MVDDACQTALVNGRTPSLRMLKALLTSHYGKSRPRDEKRRNAADTPAFTRGAAYYGGGSK
jgi:hypothetical protein